jgi:hypothetical protein
LDQSADISIGLNRSTVNTSHVINHLSFGTDYPGLKNQLDGETKTLEEASPASDRAAK